MTESNPFDEALFEAAEETGWSEETKLLLVLRFLEKRFKHSPRLLDQFQKFIDDAVAEEEEYLLRAEWDQEMPRGADGVALNCVAGDSKENDN